MKKFVVTIKEAIKKWNEKNPTLKQKNINILAEEIGATSQYVSQLGRRYSDRLEAHLEVVFDSEDKEVNKKVWESYKSLNLVTIDNVEKIRVILDCEIGDLFKKVE